MISWKDFILDEDVGFLLNCPQAKSEASGVMEDALSDSVAFIQETRQEQQPARMVGLPGLESFEFGMEADRGTSTQLGQGGGRGGLR